jgi:ubiquinone/menaquinone biosynthesis C-methylase UbiE
MHHWTLSRARHRSPGYLLVLALGAASLLLPLDAEGRQLTPQTNHYEYRQPHSPDGIGKFYRGREIAQVMGHQAAAWLERPERVVEEQPDQLISQLRLQPGSTVADIGAGTGYLSRRLAQAVGPKGKVLAVDVQPEMLALLKSFDARLGLTNIVPVLGSETNPRLPVASVDLALMADVYHEFAFPFEMMQGICRALKPGGRVVFVEYRGEDLSLAIKPLHKMTEAQVKKEASALPLDWVQTIEVLPRQHMIIFSKRGTAEPVVAAPSPFPRKWPPQ